MKKVIHFIFWIYLLIFNNVLIYSQNQMVAGIIYGSDWACFVSAPDGWIMDSESLSHYNIFALFYENGRNMGVGIPIIYINTTELKYSTDEEMKVFINWDLENHNKKGSNIVKMNYILENIEDTYLIYNLENSSGQFETIIYRRYKNTCFSIILNAPNENIRMQLYSKMVEVVISMRLMDKN